MVYSEEKLLCLYSEEKVGIRQVSVDLYCLIYVLLIRLRNRVFTSCPYRPRGRMVV